MTEDDQPAEKRKKKDSAEMRMVHLGQTKPAPDHLTLRSIGINAMNTAANIAWPHSILDPVPKKFKLQSKITKQTPAIDKKNLNSVWREKARIIVANAVIEQHKRAQKTLFGKFKNVGAIGDTPIKATLEHLTDVRRLLNFPEEWSYKLSDSDVSTLSNMAKGMNFVGVIELFQKLERGHSTCLSELQTNALIAMLDMVKERFGKPEWKSEDSTIQLHIDYRCIQGGRKAQNSILNSLNNAIPNKETENSKTNVYISIPILLCGVAPRGNNLFFRASVNPESLRRLTDNATQPVQFTSLVLEISPTKTVIKGILSQKHKPYCMEEALRVLADDYGLVNTSAQALVELDQPLSQEFFDQAADWTKKQAREYLSSHFHEGEPLETIIHDGRDFIKTLQDHAHHIDKLRAQIDLKYKRMDKIRYDVCKILNLPQKTELNYSMDVPGDKKLEKHFKKLTYLHKQVKDLKDLRRCEYRAMDGIKKSWFGWLSTQKAIVARDNKAVVVREALNILAKERTAPDYWGRTMNRYMENGSVGQYLRANSAKLKWYGIPEVTVPSYYTSSCDIRFGIVDKKQRKSQEVFKASKDGRVWNADIHAAITLAFYPILKPLNKALTDVDDVVSGTSLVTNTSIPVGLA